MNLYDQVQDHEDRIADLESNSISTDMSVDTLNNLTSFMQGTFWYTGQVNLIGGSAVISLPSVTTNSYGVCTSAVSSTNILSLACINGQATITSSSNADTSLVSYIIFI